MEASESRRAERKERRDRERRRKGAQQSDQAFGGDDVAVRVRERFLPMSPRRSTTKRARLIFPRETARFADRPRPPFGSAQVAEAYAAAKRDDVPELVRPDPASAPPAPPPRARRRVSAESFL